MSYDFWMFPQIPNLDLHETLSAQERKPGSHLFNNETKQHSIAIANILRAKNPKLDWQPIAIADFELIQVDTGENGDGVEISLFPNQASITVPYWYQGDQANNVYLQVWDYLKLIEQMTNFVIYDPQLGRTIDLEKDFDEVLATYLESIRKIDEIHPPLDENET